MIFYRLYQHIKNGVELNPGLGMIDGAIDSLWIVLIILYLLHKR